MMDQAHHMPSTKLILKETCLPGAAGAMIVEGRVFGEIPRTVRGGRGIPQFHLFTHQRKNETTRGGFAGSKSRHAILRGGSGESASVACPA